MNRKDIQTHLNNVYGRFSSLNQKETKEQKMAITKYFHLIGRKEKDGHNFGLTFAFRIKESDEGLYSIDYATSKCSYNEKQFCKKRGRLIATGRLGKESFRVVVENKREVFHYMLADYLQREKNKHFRNLIQSWFLDEQLDDGVYL